MNTGGGIKKRWRNAFFFIDLFEEICDFFFFF